MNELEIVKEKIRIRREATEQEQIRCGAICRNMEREATLSKYASKKECEAARSMARAILDAIIADEKVSNVI